MTVHMRIDRAQTARDAAYADLIMLESRRRTLEAASRAGDVGAGLALSALRPQLAHQAVIAADLDRAVDLQGLADQDDPAPVARGAEARLLALGAARLALARQVETHVGAVAELCRRIEENAEAFALAQLDAGPVAAELARFRDQFCFYLETMLDWMTGARGVAGHPSYRKLTEVMLDGETILKLYRRAVGACDGVARRTVQQNE